MTNFQLVRPNSPDFTNVDEQTAKTMFSEGLLEKLFLMPLEFGGEDRPENTVFVPRGFAAIKSGIDNNIRPLIEAGKVNQYNVRPEYHQQSFVPIAVHIHAYAPKNFATSIPIWGAALISQRVTQIGKERA